MSIYNEDELQAPDWLTKGFLENVLRSDEKNEELEILSHEVTPASMKGDHFASIMFRAKIQYQAFKSSQDFKTRSLVIKALPETESFKADMLKDFKLFETEILMYTETLPEIQSILAEHGDNTVFGPRVVYTCLKPRKILVFEDLCVEGFDCVRGRGLRLDEIQAVLTKLAKLHAVSYVIGQSEHVKKVNKYQEGLFSNMNFLEADMMSGGFKRFKRLLESDEELRVYMPQFEAVQDQVWEGCFELYNAYKNGAQGDIFVLNHGDFHARNMMFKHDKNEKLEDIMMVDFQLSIYGPSTIDLTYATYMMFDAEFRREKCDELMRFYFEHFAVTLKKIEFKGKFPTYSQLQISSIKYSCFVKFLIATFLPMMHMMISQKPEDIKDLDISEAIQDADQFMFAYMNLDFIKDLKKLLPDLLNRGFLD